MDIDELKKYRVKTTEGLVQGTRYKKVGIWKGIPYAKPPIADKRYRDPEPPEKYDGVLQAVQFGPKGPQKKSIFNADSEFVDESNEDCLYLNIWSPAADNKKRAVMVWIHGGAYAAGSGADDLFDGYSLAKNGDIVFVNINYRVSGFGYMHFGSIADDYGVEGFDNNLGLKDQVAALQWVHDNIEGFGGDPNQVTLFGESAGGAAVTTLLATPAAEGLFQRAIAQSPCVNAVISPSKARRYALDTLAELRVDPQDIEELKAIPTKEVIRATHKVVEKNILKEPGSFILTCVVDDFLPRHPLQAVNDPDAFKDVSLIIGTNSDESSVFTFGKHPLMPVKENLQDELFERIGPLHREQITSTYEGYPKKEALLDLATDWTFRMPSIWFAEGFAKNHDTWVYEFQYASPFLKLTGYGAAHSTEIPYIFHTYHSTQAKLVCALSTRASIEHMGEKMQETWLRFAKTGNPNPPEFIAQANSAFLPADSSHDRVKGQIESDSFAEKELDRWGDVRENLVKSLANFAWAGGNKPENSEARNFREVLPALPSMPSVPSLPKYEELPSLEEAFNYAKSSLKGIKLPEISSMSLANWKDFMAKQEKVEEDINEDSEWVPWPRYTDKYRAVKVINLEDYIALDPGRESRRAWNSILETIWQRSKNFHVEYQSEK